MSVPASVTIKDQDGCTHIITVKKSQRRSIGYIVKEDGGLELRLPKNIPLSAAQYYAEQKKDWFLRKQKERVKHQKQILSSEIKEGAVFYILGQPYNIQTQLSLQKKITYNDGILTVYMHKKSDENTLKMTIEDYLKLLAKKEFENSIHHALKSFSQPLPYHSFKVRMMKRSWGNMRKTGVMTLNLSLIHAPRSCIDFVVMHELCHLVHFNHSRLFYQLMDKKMPDWKSRDYQLKQYQSSFCL